jgi:hypothetical protein
MMAADASIIWSGAVACDNGYLPDLETIDTVAIVLMGLLGHRPESGGGADTECRDCKRILLSCQYLEVLIEE